MRLLAIDPGPELSAWVVYDTELKRPIEWKKQECFLVRELVWKHAGNEDGAVVIEEVASYGMSVGRDVFRTCYEIGRLQETFAWAGHPGDEPLMLERRDVKLHLCNSVRATDSNVLHALYDLYGGSRRAAVGVKASPGVLYGMKADCWQALALAITCAETRLKEIERMTRENDELDVRCQFTDAEREALLDPFCGCDKCVGAIDSARAKLEAQ